MAWIERFSHPGAMAGSVMWDWLLRILGGREGAERRRWKDALLDANLLAALMEHLPDNIYFKDRESRFIRINRSAARWYGVDDPADVVGKTDFDLFAREHAQQAFDDEQEVIRSGRPLLHKEEKETWPDGRVTWVDTSKLPLRDQHGRIIGTFGISADITEKKEAEQSLRAAKEAAEAASRAKSRFVANMSHEIRTPISAVIGLAELLLDSELTAAQRDHVETVLSSGESLLSLLNTVLDFSRVEAGKIELSPGVFELRDGVTGVVKPLEVAARKQGIGLSCRFGDDVPRFVVGDCDRLRQVLVNLISNAIKFTERGEVRVHVGVKGRDDSHAVLEFEVADTGVGIPAGKCQRIFEEFEQADKSTTRRYGGTGLGLTIASKVVELMGGTIEVESREGQGSTFRFTARLEVPEEAAAEAAIAAQTPLPVPAREQAGRSLQVLLAEDSLVNQRLAVALLQSWGHSITVVRTGSEAVEACRAGRFDLVLMDVEMPDMDGLEACTAIRAEEAGTGRHVPIIAMTANAMSGDRQRCLAAGMDEYLPKPFHKRELYDALRQFFPELGED